MEDALHGRVLGWYAEHGRDLPWRRTRDPYAVLVSELMLQQTQVSRVVPAFERFLRRFPTVHALADAPLADVLAEWSGLEYPRRARNLHLAARAITEEHGGEVPADLDALRALPGLGEYTARAVATFAHGRAEGPVEVNIARVLTRAVSGAPLNRVPLQALADDLVPDASTASWLGSAVPAAGPVEAAAAWNHALMDLGATICRPKPRCGACPLETTCAWRRGGGEDPAASSHGRSRPQGRWEGSDRQLRGRVLRALLEGPLGQQQLAAATGGEAQRLRRLLDGLAADGLVEAREGVWALPAGRPEPATQP